nr:glycosyltransferase family 2 protein [Rhodoblastus acidophilus]
MQLSVVVPCYNEENGLDALRRRIVAACQTCAADDYEIVLVNDGSSDRTWDVMARFSAQDPRVVAVNLSRNHGHQLALSAGLSLARGDRVFIIDADLQDPPELLGEMMARMDAGADVVYGQRIERQGETRFKKLSAYLFYRVLDRLVDVSIPTDTGDFRLMSRRALDVLNAMPEHHRFIRGMVSWLGFRQEAVPYARAPRFADSSKYPLAKMIRFALDAITGFSIRPLRLASYLGFAVSLIALVMMLYALISYLLGNTVSGWTSMTLIILAVASVQFMLMGVIGEYLGRLYMESKRRPLYIIDEIRTSPSASRSQSI